MLERFSSNLGRQGRVSVFVPISPSFKKLETLSWVKGDQFSSVQFSHSVLSDSL